MKTFRIYFKNGNTITVKAHHVTVRPGIGGSGLVPFYKDETTLDENILIFSSEVAAVVPEEEAPEVAAGNVTRSSSGVRER